MKTETLARWLLALFLAAAVLSDWWSRPRPRFVRVVAWLTFAWVVIGWLLLVPLAVYLIGGRAA